MTKLKQKRLVFWSGKGKEKQREAFVLFRRPVTTVIVIKAIQFARSMKEARSTYTREVCKNILSSFDLT